MSYFLPRRGQTYRVLGGSFALSRRQPYGAMRLGAVYGWGDEEQVLGGGPLASSAYYVDQLSTRNLSKGHCVQHCYCAHPRLASLAFYSQLAQGPSTTDLSALPARSFHDIGEVWYCTHAMKTYGEVLGRNGSASEGHLHDFQVRKPRDLREYQYTHATETYLLTVFPITLCLLSSYY